MSEPKPITVHRLSNVTTFRTGFYRLDKDKPIDGDTTYLYDNGAIYRLNSKSKKGHINYAHSNLHNEGPVHADDWYWNEDEQRMKKMSTLSEEEYLEVTMSDGIRITISEWDELAYSKALLAARQQREKMDWERALFAKHLAQEALMLEQKYRS